MGHDSRAMPRKQIYESIPRTWTTSWLERKNKAELSTMAAAHGLHLSTTMKKAMMVAELWQLKEKEDEAETGYIYWE